MKPALRVKFLGSSPRVRGTRRVVLIAANGQRFIPACAGNTLRFGAIQR